MLGLGAASFCLFGLLIVLVGANQAALAGALSIDLAGTGMLASALTAGVGLGIVTGGPLFDRLPRRWLLCAAHAGVALALGTFEAEPSHASVVARLIAAGVGAGVYNTVVNASVAETYRAEASGPLAIVHASATIGAMAAPPLFGWVTSGWSLSAAFRVVGVAHLLLAVGALVLVRAAGRVAAHPEAFRAVRPVDDARPEAPDPAAVHTSPEAVPADQVDGRRETDASPRALGPFLGIVFGYVGAEAVASVFAVPYVTGALGLDASRGRWSITAYWAGLLVGRVALWLARARRPGTELVTRASAAGALVFLVAGLWPLGPVELVFALAGACLGAVFPHTIALVGERFAGARGTATGLVGGAGALGGALVPWIAGAAGDRWGASTLMLVAAASAALVTVTSAAALRREPDAVRI